MCGVSVRTVMILTDACESADQNASEEASDGRMALSSLVRSELMLARLHCDYHLMRFLVRTRRRTARPDTKYLLAKHAAVPLRSPYCRQVGGFGSYY